MLQGERPILKGCVKIGLGQMPGVACFSKKTKIGDAQSFYQRAFFTERCHAGPLLKGSVDQKQAKEDHIDEGIYQKQARSSHGFSQAP